MICLKCKTRNAIGFKFCHECGAPMSPSGELAAEEAIQAEAERRSGHAAALVAGALELREQRQYSEAIPLAEEAAEILPDSSTTFALLASLYERTGDHEKAILAMERVAALNPDSVADRLRLEKMKQGLLLPEERSRRSSFSLRRFAPIGAAAIIAGLVFAIGNYFLNSGVRATRAPVSAGIVETGGPGAINAPGAAGVIGTPDNPGYIAPPADSRPDPFAPLVQKAYDNPSPSARERASNSLPTPRPSAVRERESPSGIVVSRRVPPATVPLPSNEGNSGENQNPGGLPAFGSGNNDNASGNGFGNGGRIRVGPPNGDNNASAPANTPDSGDSYIHIQVRPQDGAGDPPGKNAAPPATNNDDGARTGESALSRGRRLYRSGKYREAIAAYRESGGGEAQQGVAEAYRRLGESDSARAAYRDAIRIYDGQGNSAGAQTCRAALEVLGG